MSWIYGTPGLSESFIIEPQMFLFRHFNVVLLERVRLLFVEVDQPIEQFEILQTFLDVAVLPEPVLSSVDVVQHVLDFVVAKRASSACCA